MVSSLKTINKDEKMKILKDTSIVESKGGVEKAKQGTKYELS